MTDIYRALSDPIRRRILQLLAQLEYTQSEIVKNLTISQPAIKKHLNILEETGKREILISVPIKKSLAGYDHPNQKEFSRQGNSLHR